MDGQLPHYAHRLYKNNQEKFSLAMPNYEILQLCQLKVFEILIILMNEIIVLTGGFFK